MLRKRKKTHVLVRYILLCLILFGTANQIQATDAVNDASLTPKGIKKEIPSEGTKIHFIQLTNGEATFIQLNHGQTILIDTGSRSSEYELIRYLDQHGVTHINHLFLTNDTDEHAGNIDELLNQFVVDHLYFPYHIQTWVAEKVPSTEEIKHHAIQREQEISFGAEQRIRILHPSQDLSLTPQDNSLVLQFIHGKNKILFTSDITDAVEKALTKAFDLHSQVLKVSDFGSNQASCGIFLAEVDAHVGIIFHRPDFYLHEDVVERLEESWMDVYPLKKHGHMIISSTADDYEVFVIEKTKDFTDGG